MRVIQSQEIIGVGVSCSRDKLWKYQRIFWGCRLGGYKSALARIVQIRHVTSSAQLHPITAIRRVISIPTCPIVTSAMFAARRCAVSSRQLLRSQPPRRFGSSHAHAEPVNESFGVSFHIPAGPPESRNVREDSIALEALLTGHSYVTAQFLRHRRQSGLRLRPLPAHQVHQGIRLRVLDLWLDQQVDSFPGGFRAAQCHSHCDVGEGR